jgi:hypothetical protein
MCMEVEAELHAFLTLALDDVYRNLPTNSFKERKENKNSYRSRMGNLKEGLLRRGLRETGRGRLWERSVCFYGALRREPGGRLLFWEIWKICKEGSGDGRTFHM